VNSNAMGGLLLAVIGVGIAWLWYRGYFGDLITNATGGMSGTTGKRAFNPLGLVASISGRAPSTGLGKAMVRI
jgi:hypothetical protein